MWLLERVKLTFTSHTTLCSIKSLVLILFESPDPSKTKSALAYIECLPLPIAVGAAPASSFTSATCYEYVIVLTRGTNKPQGSSGGFVSMINQTLTAISGGIEYDAVHPAGGNTQSQGVTDIVKYVEHAPVRCLEQKYLLLGYSQGAVAIAEAVSTFNNTSGVASNAMIAALVIDNLATSPKKRATSIDSVAVQLPEEKFLILIPLHKEHGISTEAGGRNGSWLR